MPPEEHRPPALERLLARIEAREAVVGVVGLGYIGLPIAAAMVDAGFRTLGFDVSLERVAGLMRGETPLRHLGEGFARALLESGRWEASSEFLRLRDVDAVLICVPTPLDADDRPDLRQVRTTTQAVARTLRSGQLVVLESTTYPGTTRDVVAPLLAQARGEHGPLVCGRDVFLAYSPEREDPGRTEPATRAIPRLVGGVDAPSLEAAVRLYRAAVQTVVPVSSAEVAEAAKLLENIYRAVNIAMVNEMKLMLTAMGVDVHEVIDAAATKPFGFAAFRPGPGWGGHCIPIDPFYLAWKAREVGQPARFIELAGAVNREMPERVVERTRVALEARGVPLAAARILVLGLAYKPDVDDVRESPSLQLLRRFAGRGAGIAYHDPHVPRMPVERPPGLPELASVPLDAGTLAAHDAVVIATDHRAVDYALVLRAARLVVDTRGALRHLPREAGSAEVVSA
jgi:UDP-N-acetyl-D-glucosamine dehydrogenase